MEQEFTDKTLGCNPACVKVGGPFPLHGAALFGHLSKNGTHLAAADFENGGVDIYAYTLASLKYLYSFNNGLSAGNLVIGVAYNPRSKE